MDKELKIKAQEVRKELIRQVEECNEQPEVKLAYMNDLKDMSDLSVLKKVFPAYQRFRSKNTFHLSPSLMKRSPLNFTRGEIHGMRELGNDLIQVVQKIDAGLFFNFYIIKGEQGPLYATCLMGQALDCLSNEKLDMIVASEYTQQVFPVISKMMEVTDNNELSSSVTLKRKNWKGVDTWFLSLDLEQKCSWMDLQLYGIKEAYLLECAIRLLHLQLDVLKEIYQSGNSKLIKDMDDFFGFHFPMDI